MRGVGGVWVGSERGGRGVGEGCEGAIKRCCFNVPVSTMRKHFSASRMKLVVKPLRSKMTGVFQLLVEYIRH